MTYEDFFANFKTLLSNCRINKNVIKVLQCMSMVLEMSNKFVWIYILSNSVFLNELFFVAS